MGQRVLVIGSGGREHALIWKLAQSPRIDKLCVAPGNGGTSQIVENVPIGATDIQKLAEFAERHVDLTVVGPDDPLALGIVDAFEARCLRVFGPTRAAAQIEASKAFAKNAMKDASVPTAPFRILSRYDQALSYVRQRGAPIVVKASGLALGKGAYVCKTLEEAERAVLEIMVNRVHGEAGNEVVVEDFLKGQEISIHAFCDGTNSILFPPAQDHKPVRDNDEGRNTGGMGTIAPVPWVSQETVRQIDRLVIKNVLAALVQGGRRFKGCLYPGIKVTTTGPQVLEFNARFGDPETQSYMRLVKSDLLDILEACVDGALSQIHIEWHSGFAACVVIASGGYPDQYARGIPIHGIREAERVPSVVVFHAGTSNGHELVTSGGRVLGISATGDTLRAALDRAYEAVSLIKFEGMHYRTDIGRTSLAMVS